MYGQVVLGIEHHHFEELLENHKLDTGASLDTDLSVEDWKIVVAGFKDIVTQERGHPFPQAAARPAVGRDRRRLRVVDEPARDDLSAIARDPRRLGHRGQCPGDGVRQYGDGLRDRRRLHPQPVDRHGRVLRRIPGQRPGRRCRRRHPHPATPDDRRQGRQQIGLAGDGRSHARGPRRAVPGASDARRPLLRHAGHRVYRAARQVVDAADADRQAHRPGRAEDRRVAGRGGDHRPRRGDPAHRPQFARSAVASDPRPAGGKKRPRPRSAGVSRCGLGQDRVFGKRGRSRSPCAARR